MVTASDKVKTAIMFNDLFKSVRDCKKILQVGEARMSGVDNLIDAVAKAYSYGVSSGLIDRYYDGQCEGIERSFVKMLAIAKNRIESLEKKAYTDTCEILNGVRFYGLGFEKNEIDATYNEVNDILDNMQVFDEHGGFQVVKRQLGLNLYKQCKGLAYEMTEAVLKNDFSIAKFLYNDICDILERVDMPMIYKVNFAKCKPFKVTKTEAMTLIRNWKKRLERTKTDSLKQQYSEWIREGVQLLQFEKFSEESIQVNYSPRITPEPQNVRSYETFKPKKIRLVSSFDKKPFVKFMNNEVNIKNIDHIEPSQLKPIKAVRVTYVRNNFCEEAMKHVPLYRENVSKLSESWEKSQLKVVEPEMILRTLCSKNGFDCVIAIPATRLSKSRLELYRMSAEKDMKQLELE